ncbi:MAG: M4 family metallopeptidase, partial [Saprospiraceae bacterium]|nr:M4 family metallopeptidase [Saprospiraceae bacterium]
MKRSIVFSLCLLLGQLYAQDPVSLQKEIQWKDWDEATAIKTHAFFDQIRSSYQLDEALDWREVNRSQDALSMEHIRFDQFYKDLPVLGHQYILHSKNGKVVKSNGQLALDLEIPTQPFLSKEEALEMAKAHMKADVYAWEHDRPFFGKTRNKPTPELVVVDALYPRTSGIYLLAYSIDLYAKKPHKRENVLVNAWNGEIINSIPLMYSCGGDVGQAETLYYGEREIITTATDSGYILLDDTRGGGIITMRTDSSMFVDQDNYWESGTSTHENGVLDAHVGVGASYDYFFNTFQRKGYDDKNTPIPVIVYIDQDFNNAFWNGESVTFGDGDGTNYGPFSAIDVCAHELTHGVTEYSAGLVYQYESGALNEGFSDIFGKAVEAEFDPDNFTWELGLPMQIGQGAGFRNMADPNLYEHPKLYKGLHWVANSSDNGGVHSNSGVINYWYYLLCEGGSGMNENLEEFNVDSMGMEKASQIAYRALTQYLTPTSQYLDARFATLEATEDLYGGICSDEYRMVAEAWMAVGVGERVLDGDLSVFDYRTNLRVCDGRELEINTRIINNGCQTTIPEGTNIEVSYSISQADTVKEIVQLTEDLEPGSYFDYTFNQTASLGMNGGYVVELMIDYPNDADTSNNSETFYVEQTENLEFDANLRIVRFQSPACGSVDDSLRMTVGFLYEGCSIIPTGEMLQVEVEIGGNTQTIDLELERDLYPESFFFDQIFLKDIPFGENEATVTIYFPGDTNDDNDEQMSMLVYLQSSLVGYEERFDDLSFDSTRMTIAPGVHPQRYLGKFGLRNHNEEDFLVLTGSFPEISKPAMSWEEFQNLNDRFIANVNICYQSNGWTQPRLVFDLAQTRSSFNYGGQGINPNWANTLSVYFFGEGIQPLQDEIRDFKDSIEFNTYSYALPVDIDLVNITLRGLLLKGEELPTGELSLDDQDLILLDNIRIVETVNTNDEVYTDVDI